MKFLYVVFFLISTPEGGLEHLGTVSKTFSTLEECNQEGRARVAELNEMQVTEFQTVSTCVELP